MRLSLRFGIVALAGALVTGCGGSNLGKGRPTPTAAPTGGVGALGSLPMNLGLLEGDEATEAAPNHRVVWMDLEPTAPQRPCGPSPAKSWNGPKAFSNAEVLLPGPPPVSVGPGYVTWCIGAAVPPGAASGGGSPAEPAMNLPADVALLHASLDPASPSYVWLHVGVKAGGIPCVGGSALDKPLPFDKFSFMFPGSNGTQYPKALATLCKGSALPARTFGRRSPFTSLPMNLGLLDDESASKGTTTSVAWFSLSKPPAQCAGALNVGNLVVARARFYHSSDGPREMRVTLCAGNSFAGVPNLHAPHPLNADTSLPMNLGLLEGSDTRGAPVAIWARIEEGGSATCTLGSYVANTQHSIDNAHIHREFGKSRLVTLALCKGIAFPSPIVDPRPD